MSATKTKKGPSPAIRKAVELWKTAGDKINCLEITAEDIEEMD